MLTSDQQAAVAELLSISQEWRKRRRLDYFEPYLKQFDFFAAGAICDQRALIAANQVGKTMCGGFEDAVHATGEYPAWWPGHRFKRPTTIWIAGPTGEKVRDTTQAMLFGEWNKPDEFGSGLIPREAIVGKPTLARGVSGAYDTATVKCKINGALDDSALSTVTFKSYVEGPIGFASNTIDVYHGDEESISGIYSEARVRLQVKKGISYVTLTPLLGRTPFLRHLEEAKGAGMAAIINMGIYDACVGHDPRRPLLGHYTREEADRKVAGFPAHERGARAYGEVAMGQGRIFLTPETAITTDRFDIPPHWRKIWGVDFGGQGPLSHPFGAALLAYDMDTDICYLAHTVWQRGTTKLQHIPPMRAVAADTPVAWPHDGNERRDGDTIAGQYKNPMPGMPGLLMLPKHATWPDGGFSTWAAVNELEDRCRTGRFFAFSDQHQFFSEYRQYHQEIDDNGVSKIVPIDDDVLSAIFKGLMMKRFAKPGYLTAQVGRVGKYQKRTDEWWKPDMTAGDIDPFTGREVPR